MKRRVLIVLGLAATSAAIAAQNQPARIQPSTPTPKAALPGAAPTGDGPLIITPDKVDWTPAPAAFRTGLQMAVLEGDPMKEGPFVIRVKAPDGFRFAPHTHPGVERVTVLQGTMNIGVGNTFDEKATRPMPAGSFMRLPAAAAHFAIAKGETIFQINGTGPWGVTYVNPADDPRTAPAAPGTDKKH